MERHQDWCLECGTAAPGRLGGLRPGWRAVSTTLALTLALVGSAGAASYAALSSDANREAIAGASLDGAPVAQAPPAVPAPAAPTVPAIPVPLPAAPKVTTPAAKLPVAPKVTVPTDTKTTAQVTPPPSSSQTPTTSSSGSTTRSATAGARGEGTSASGAGSTSTAKLEPIALEAGAVSIYDPYGRVSSPGNPADAHDGDAGSTFTFGAPDDDRELQIGVVVDLEAAKQVRGLEFTTTTPGGRAEVYATDGSALPPDILDTRWDHPSSRATFARKERIVFPKGGAKYRYVTLWFTTPAEGKRRVSISELKLLR